MNVKEKGQSMEILELQHKNASFILLFPKVTPYKATDREEWEKFYGSQHPEASFKSPSCFWKAQLLSS